MNSIPATPASTAPRWLHISLATALLAILTVLVFANGSSAPFYLDDQQVLERNPAIRSISGAIRSLPTRRIGMLSFALNYRAHGFEVAGYHLVNIAIHMAAGVLLFDLIRRTLQLPDIPPRLAEHAVGVGTVVAAVWLVHPLQTGAVTYVIQRFESLMGFWFLLSLYALLRGATSAQARVWYGVSLLAAALGAQTKEVIAVLPVVALTYDRIYLADSWRAVWRRRGWFHGALWLVPLWIVFQMRSALIPERAMSAGFGVRGITPWEYLSSQAGVIVHYLKLCFWPRVLCLDYQWPVARSPLEIYPYGAVILALLAMTGWALYRYPRCGFLGLSFFAILAPTSSIMPIADLAFEHRMYLPLISVVVLATVGAIVLAERLLPSPEAQRRVLLLLAGFVLFAFTARTFVRNRDYVDPVRMWTSVLAVSPRNYRAHNQLAIQYERLGKLDEAERHFAETLKIRPDAWWVDIGMGNLRVRQDRLDDAERHFRQALANKSGVALASANLGRLMERQEKWQEAADFYEQSVKRDPGFLDAWHALAKVQRRLGNKELAADAYRAILQRDPRSKAALQGLADIRGAE